MRENIEFDAPIENGKIIVPSKYEKAVREAVRAHVRIENDLTKARERDFIDELLERPLHAPNFRKMTRDEMHER